MSEQVYSLKKTIAKGSTPIAVMVLVKILVEVAGSQGLTIDYSTALTVAMGGYGAVIGFMNWLKNKKKGK